MLVLSVKPYCIYASNHRNAVYFLATKCFYLFLISSIILERIRYISCLNVYINNESRTYIFHARRNCKRKHLHCLDIYLDKNTHPL